MRWEELEPNLFGRGDMSYKIWIYHKTEDPRIIDSEEWERYKEQGWSDTPATFKNNPAMLNNKTKEGRIRGKGKIYGNGK